MLYSEARVLGLGPRFMSIYITKLAVSVFLTSRLLLILNLQDSYTSNLSISAKGLAHLDQLFSCRLSGVYTMMKWKA